MYFVLIDLSTSDFQERLEILKTEVMYHHNQLHHFAAIEDAITNKGKVDHTVMQGVFLGPARSGKSSLIKRLLKKELNPSSPSTGAADKIIQVSVKKSSSSATSIFESTWLHLTYVGEAVRLMMLAAKTYENKPVDSDIIATPFPSDYNPVAIPEMPTGYISPRQTFENALSSGGPRGINALRQHLDGPWTLYLSDTGGQMEFQELLPLLVSGPSLFFVVFPLHRDLNELFTIQYELPDGQQSEPYQSSLTLKEAILQSLATIAAMGTFTYKGVGDESVKLKPKVLLVGTHKDLLNPATVEEDIKKKDAELQQMITTKSYYRENLIESASRNQFIFAVNNLADNDDDFAAIRARVNTIAKLSRYQMSIPTHWLVFSLVIRNLSDRVISYGQCYNVAQQCGIDSEEELKETLWFLHTKMGVIRHFPYGDLSKIVVIDPQLLFDRITELIVKTFTFENAGQLLCDEFEKKGIFSLEDFERISATSDPFLTHSCFIELLKYLRIVVPFLDGKKLFIPCVLAHADKALYPPRQHSAVPTLAIVFDCGYCPKGVTGSVIKYLMTNEMQSKFVWKLQEDQIFRDQVSFFVGPNLITLCLYPTHFEVVYAPSTEHAEAICSIKETCHEICQSIKSAIQTVSKDINLTCHCNTTFYCTLCKSHIAELVQHRGIPCQLWCNETRQLCKFPDGYQYWFEPPPQNEPEVSHNPSTVPVATTLTLPSAYKITFSLASEWKNIGLFLELDIGTLDKIEHDYRKANDCLREMLHTWIKQVSPPPSWQALTDAVEPFDPAVAEKIRTTYCNI